MRNKKKRAGIFMLTVLLALGLSANLSAGVSAYDEAAPAQYSSESFDIEFTPIPDDELEAVRKSGELNREAVLSAQLPQRYESLYSTSNLYYYNQMNTNEKDLYNKIVKSCDNLLNSYADVNSGSSGYYFLDYIPLNSSMTEDTVHKVIFAVYFSNPQFFFLNNNFFYSGNSGGVTSVAPVVRNEFINGNIRMEANRKIQNVTADWMGQINGLRTGLEKEKWIAEKLCETITYQSSVYDQTIAGALIERKCVCNGYAMAMTYFCNAAGLNCMMLTSHNHAWNMIYLNGVWYEVDVTWMDQTDNWLYINGKWFNKSRSTFISNDDSDNSHRIDSKHTGILGTPECTKDYPSCTNHVWEDGIVTKEATASSYGYKFHFCSVCSDAESIPICPDGFHSWGEYLSDGKSHWRICSVCQSMEEKAKHSFKDGVCSFCKYVKPFGDLNDDGVLNNADIILLGRSYMAGDSAKYVALADMNNDGKITNADIILLGRLYMSL